MAKLGRWRSLEQSEGARDLDPSEAAYVGAMLDAEGSIQARPTGRVLIKIDNAEVEVISALLRATGLGKVYGYCPTQGNCVMFCWCLFRLADVRHVCLQIAPWSLKAQETLAKITEIYAEWCARRESWTNACLDCNAPLSIQGRTRRPRRCPSCAGRWRWAHGVYDHLRRKER